MEYLNFIPGSGKTESPFADFCEPQQTLHCGAPSQYLAFPSPANSAYTVELGSGGGGEAAEEEVRGLLGTAGRQASSSPVWLETDESIVLLY